ncbi:hypothetical protein ACFLZB_04435 [Nanoarchaeota archaeon]
MVDPEGKFWRGQERTSVGQVKRVWGAGQTVLYFFLLILSFLPLLVVGWDFSAHAVVSAILALVFIFVMMKNFGFWKATLLVGIVYVIDIGFIALPIELISSTEIGKIFIAVKLFAIWPIFATIIYLIDISKTENAPRWAKAIGMALIVVVFAIVIPAMGVDSYTTAVKEHENYQIAKQKAEEVGESAKELLVNKTVPYWKRFVSAVPFLFKGDMEGYRNTLNPPQNLTQVIERAGAIDPTIKEYTKVDFVQGEEFTREIYSKRYPVPVQMEIESPRSTIDMEINCSFKAGTKVVPGSASPSQLTVLKGDEEEKVITCFPNEDLTKGGWTVQMEAVVSNLETFSTLRRLFVGEKTTEEKEELKKAYFPRSEDYKAQHPNEFVRIGFLIGEPPTNPIIDDNDNPLLTATIENIGKGEIENIELIKITLPNGLLAVNDATRCSLLDYEDQEDESTVFTKTDFNVGEVKGKKNIPLGICALDVEPRLKYPEEPFIHTTAEANIRYSYKIKKTFSISVNPLG